MPTKFDPGYSYGDLILKPRHSSIFPAQVDTSINLDRKLQLRVPIITSPMRSVTGLETTIAAGRAGALGILPRSYLPDDLIETIFRAKQHEVPVGVALDLSYRDGTEFLKLMRLVERAVKAGADLILGDTADADADWYGDSLAQVCKVVSALKQEFPHIVTMGGNIATYDAASYLIDAGASTLRVGIGPGHICIYRTQTGNGVPQATAIREVARALAVSNRSVQLIADGGIETNGQIVIALALGASAVMMGNQFAGCDESPAPRKRFRKEDVPERYHRYFGKWKSKEFCLYSGMGSPKEIEHSLKLKQREYHGLKNTRLPAGGEIWVPACGPISDKIAEMQAAIVEGMYAQGCQRIEKLWEYADFYICSHSAQQEHGLNGWVAG
ncbi:MAG: guanosine monophosphate reductase [Patescibacteria group bacterium]|jgi:IMP dehydrogenase